MDNSSSFHFYLKFARPLILALPKQKDRILATAWVRRFMEQPDDSDKTKYLKLLLFVLQSRTLKGMFLEHPSHFETLPPYTDELYEDCIFVENKLEPQPVFTEYSGDLQNYVAYQPVPNMGVQGFYAISREPIYNWERFDASIFPRSVSRADGAIMTTMADDEPLIKVEGNLAEEERKEQFASNLMRELDYKKYASLVKPIGIPAHDDRLPPTWGSNLIQVTDMEKEFHEDFPWTRTLDLIDKL